jgi:hypothetical protein
MKQACCSSTDEGGGKRRGEHVGGSAAECTTGHARGGAGPSTGSVAAPAAWRCWRRCAGPHREQPGNKPHRCYLSYEIRDWCRKATPPSPHCIAGHRRREHPRPSRPAAKWKAREGPLQSLPSPVCRLQPRPAFPQGSHRDIFAPRPRSWAYISLSILLPLAYPITDQGLRNSTGSLAKFTPIP